MWPAALITAGAAAFGRLFVAGILPSALLVSTLGLTWRANAYNPSTAGLSVGSIVPLAATIDTNGVLLLLLAVSVITAVLQSFHISIVRIFEGYWGNARIGRTLFAAGVRRQIDRRTRSSELRVKADELIGVGDSATLDISTWPIAAQREYLKKVTQARLDREVAISRLQGYPPADDDVMPTVLGNALRASERSAGERYGWSTVHAWPRLFPKLDPSLAAPCQSVSDAIDAAAIFTLTLLTCAVISVVAFYDDPALWWLIAAFAMLALLSYRGAVVSALLQRTLLCAAFDLHRFELYEGMHIPLPATPAEELTLASHVSNFLATGGLPGDARRQLLVRYSHAPQETLKERVQRAGTTLRRRFRLR